MANNDERLLTILYGSQTGNAQDVSERIWRESKRFHFAGTVKPMDEYKITSLINEKCVVFVCSTTGQGEEPDNMKSFWKFLLRKNLPANSLSDVKCAVLGLGDSSYVKFNFVAKRLYKRLIQLGADMIAPLALGDDQHDLGYDAVVDVWIDSLWKKLLEIFPLPENLTVLNADIAIKPRWNVNIVDKEVENNKKSLYYNESVKIPDNQFWVQVLENSRITSSSHFQDVRLIKFRTTGQEYKPGDVLCIRPKNSQETINKFFEILTSNGVDWDPKMAVQISEKDLDMPVPLYLQDKIELRQLCEEYFDLNSIPRRYVFSVLAQLTNSDLEREKCLEFTTSEGQEELYNYCNRPRRNITEVLGDFPHAVENLSLDVLFEIFPAIKSRAFSIASSFQAHRNELHILVAVVKYKSKLVKERLGLCSNWLASLKPGQEVPVWIKSGSFRFPESEVAPIIMVGPGTGVAPFRNYIWELQTQLKTNSSNLILFFGCRNQAQDFHFKDEFEKLQNENKLCLFCAFSRDQDHKIYVQHKIEENGKSLWDLLKNKEGFVYVAGNSKNMPQSVREAFVNVCKKHVSEEEAEKLIAYMEKNGQYQTETWS